MLTVLLQVRERCSLFGDSSGGEKTPTPLLPLLNMSCRGDTRRGDTPSLPLFVLLSRESGRSILDATFLDTKDKFKVTTQ